MTQSSPKTVLNVGQCHADFEAMRRQMDRWFGVRVESCADIDSTVKLLTQETFDLVLVNRIFDVSGEEGLDLIRRMKESPFLRCLPVMLISNFTHVQQEAEQLGAEPGFGKADLAEEVTRALLEKYFK